MSEGLKCPKCGHEIDRANPVCPGCGAKLKFRPLNLPETSSAPSLGITKSVAETGRPLPPPATGGIHRERPSGADQSHPVPPPVEKPRRTADAGKAPPWFRRCMGARMDVFLQGTRLAEGILAPASVLAAGSPAGVGRGGDMGGDARKRAPRTVRVGMASGGHGALLGIVGPAAARCRDSRLSGSGKAHCHCVVVCAGGDSGIVRIGGGIVWGRPPGQRHCHLGNHAFLDRRGARNRFRASPQRSRNECPRPQSVRGDRGPSGRSRATCLREARGPLRTSPLRGRQRNREGPRPRQSFFDPVAHMPGLRSEDSSREKVLSAVRAGGPCGGNMPEMRWKGEAGTEVLSTVRTAVFRDMPGMRRDGGDRPEILSEMRLAGRSRRSFMPKVRNETGIGAEILSALRHGGGRKRQRPGRRNQGAHGATSGFAHGLKHCRTAWSEALCRPSIQSATAK